MQRANRYCNSTRFRGRENSRIDAPQNNDGKSKPNFSGPEFFAHIREAKYRVRSVTNFSNTDINIVYDQHHDNVEDYTSRFAAVENQVGVMFAIDGEIEGMDLFDATDTFATMLPKLARSFAIDAIETASQETKPLQQSSATQFLDRVAAAQADTYPGVGLGTDVRLSAQLVAGGALVHEDKLIHLAAFRTGAPRPAGTGDRDERRSTAETRLRSQRYAQMRRRNNSGNGSGEGNGED